MIHVITGDGKGKTTSSLGLALRSLGANKKIALIQFMKKPEFSEHVAIKKYKLPIDFYCFGIGFYKILNDKHTTKEHILSCEKALNKAENIIKSKKYDLIILDEINVALGFKLIKISKVINLIKTYANYDKIDIVLTGRHANSKLIKIADTVSEIKDVKNYFHRGISARKGIEY